MTRISFSSGSSIIISNNRIMADGKIVYESGEPLIVEIHGDVNNVRTDGDLYVKGSVFGSVESKSYVECKEIHGDVYAENNVYVSSVKGNISSKNTVAMVENKNFF